MKNKSFETEEIEHLNGKAFALYKYSMFSEYTEPLLTQISENGTIMDNKPAPTKVTLKSSDMFNEFELYDATFSLKYNKHGYYLDDYTNTYKDFSYYFEKNEFEIFKSKKSNFLFCAESYKVSDIFFKELDAFSNKKRKDTGIRVEKLNLKLKNLTTVGTITGAWFDIEDLPNVNSASSFGVNVNLSTIYDDLDKKGKLKSLTVSIPFNGISYTVIVSTHSSIAILNDANNQEKLNLIEYLINILV